MFHNFCAAKLRILSHILKFYSDFFRFSPGKDVFFTPYRLARGEKFENLLAFWRLIRTFAQ